MTVARHELTEDWSEVMGLTDDTTYRCWLVGAWRPAFIWTGMDAPAVDAPGSVLRSGAPRCHGRSGQQGVRPLRSAGLRAAPRRPGGFVAIASS